MMRALLLCLVALPLQAETLADAWNLALERNNALAAVRSQADAARADADAARAERWPKLSVEGSYQRFGDAPAFSFPVGGQDFLSPPLVDDDDFYAARAHIELPLFTAGRITAGIESAELGARAAGSASDSAVQDLKLAVAAAYVDVLRAGSSLTAAESQVESLGSLVNDVTVMLEQETVAKNDLLAAQLTLAEAEQERLRAANRLSIARAQYNRLLGEPLDRIPDLAELHGAPPDTAAAGDSLDALVATAISRRSDLASLDARTRSLDERARSARAAGWPQLSLMADYQYLENQVLDREDFSLVGIGFNWTVFDGGRIRNQAASFANAGRAAGRSRDDLRSRIELEVRQAWLDREEANARVAVTREAVAQAEENLRVARELYGVGLTTNTVVLDAEALRLKAVSNADNARFDAVLSDLRLARATGGLR
ncbi:MAG: TolC family protein [Gammaproteobacteria bacterium]|nr:TolC family protein [Gammaproteobacteria bacterium]MCP5140555.1 TolC family protein [Chromatiales bacterium]